jgi:hypothetical protein
LNTKQGLLLTADSVVESMKRLQDETAEKEQQKKQRQIDREAQKERRLKEKQEKQAEQEEKRKERQTRDGEDRRMIPNRKRHHPSDDTSSLTDVVADKENHAERYLNITIDTSQLQYTHTQRVLGEIQSITSQQSSIQNVVISQTKRYQLMSCRNECIRLRSL